MPSPPSFDVPSGNVAKVSIIDSTLRLSEMETSLLIKPPMTGFDKFPTVPSWSFLVESSSGKKALFDLGVPVDINTFAPVVTAKLKSLGLDIKVEKNVADILEENEVNLYEIDSIIWR